MPYNRPSISQIAARVKQDVQGALASSAAFYRRSFERGVAAAVTGVAHGLYGHAAWIARQMDPTTADYEQLRAIHAAPRGITPKPATQTRLRLLATGATVGAVIPAGAQYERGDGAVYTVDSNATILVSGTAVVEVTSVLSGQSTNTDNGATFTLASSISGVDDDALLTETILAGANAETKEELLDRVMQRGESHAKGGARGDFAAWALEVPGLTRAWEYPRQEGAGTVVVYGVNDQASPISLTGPKITEVSTYMRQAGRAPVTADARIYTPTIQPVDFAIRISPNTAEVRAAARAELDEHFRRATNPGGMTLLLSEMNEAISIATGELDHEIITPTANVAVPFGSIAVVGAVVWSTL